MEAGKKISVKNLEQFILEWNSRFRYDRLWRKKYNVAFGSREHLEANQIDIYIDILEDKLANKIKSDLEQKEKDKRGFEKTGKLLKEQIESEEEVDDLLKNFKFK